MTEEKERRGAHRAPMGTGIQWTADGHEWHDDRTRDISSTGMMLLTQEAIEPESEIRLQFNLPNLKMLDPIVARAKVVRVVEKHGRRIGVGVHFVSLKSRNYQVVQEFVYRILGMPMDDVIGADSIEGSAGYALKMEQFAREAALREEKAFQKKMAQEQAEQKKENIRLWFWRGVKVLLIGIAVYGVSKFAIFLLELAERMQSVAH